MFGFTFACSNLASVRSESNLLFAFLIVMSSHCSALSFVFTLSSALSHRLTQPWTCRNKLGPAWLDLLRLRKKMLNESNTPALLNSVVTLWDVFVMFSKSNFWGGELSQLFSSCLSSGWAAIMLLCVNVLSLPAFRTARPPLFPTPGQ